MRRTLGLFLAAVIVFGVSAEVAAQEDEPTYLRTPHNFHLFIDGGIAVPASPAGYKDYWNSTLPLTLGGGGVVFSWLDINGVFTFATFSNNHVKTKQTIDYSGIGEVEGGDFTSIMLAVTARFLGVPNGRANPYYEIGIGSFTNSFDNLIIVDPNSEDQTPILERQGEDTSGIMISNAFGLQYAMNERWSSYVKFVYTVNLNGDFDPGALVGQSDPGNQQYTTMAIGMLVRM